MPLVVGVPVTLIDPFVWLARPRLFLEVIAAERGTHAWMPNFAFRYLARCAGDVPCDLSSLRVLVNCSEPCGAETMAHFRETFRPWGLNPKALKTCYAMAETVFAVSQTPGDAEPETLAVDRRSLEKDESIRPGEDLVLVSSGPPLPGVRISVLSPDGTVELPEGKVGQLAISAPFLFSGYNGLPEETAAKLVNGRYLTGDRGFLWNGSVWVLGRMDDMMIINGRKLHAVEIENCLADFPGLRPGRVIGFAKGLAELGSRGLVVVAERADANADPVRLAREIRERIFGVFAVMPHIVAIRDAGWLIKTTSGKISRTENQRKFEEEADHA